MTRQARSALRGTIATAVALAVAFATATIIAVLDWQLNPGGIFHDETGTRWQVVWVTWSSWFFPTVFVSGALVALGLSLLAWRRRRRAAAVPDEVRASHASARDSASARR